MRLWSSGLAGEVPILAGLRGTLIGPGGKQIKAIREASGAQIELNDETNTAVIFARSAAGLEVRFEQHKSHTNKQKNCWVRVLTVPTWWGKGHSLHAKWSWTLPATLPLAPS